MPGLRQVLEAGQCGKPLASALADDSREVSEGGDVGHLVQGQDHRRPRDGGVDLGPGIGSPPHLLDEAHHQRCHQRLLPAGCTDINGVPGVDKCGRVKVDLGGGSQGRLRSVGSQYAGRGGPDATSLPLFGSQDPVQHLSGQSGAVALEDPGRRQRRPAVHPGHDVGHREVVQGCGMQQRCEHRLRPLGPVAGLRHSRRRTGCSHHGSSGDHRGIPASAGSDGRPVQRLHPLGDGYLSARIEQPALPNPAAGDGGGIEHVGLDRGAQHRTIGSQHVGNHNGEGLARARRPQHQHRLLRACPNPTSRPHAQIDGMAGGSRPGSDIGQRLTATHMPILTQDPGRCVHATKKHPNARVG